MSAHTPIKYPTRAWSSMSEFNQWFEELERTLAERKTPATKTTKDGQKLSFDTYLLAPSKTSNFALCLCGVGDDFLDNYILIDGELSDVPLQWSENGLTATQIVEGKISKKMMRSHKLALCQVEDSRRKWFEVTVLNDDLSYPFNACMLGLKCWAFTDYAPARRKFKQLRRESEKLLHRYGGRT